MVLATLHDRKDKTQQTGRNKDIVSLQLLGGKITQPVTLTSQFRCANMSTEEGSNHRVLFNGEIKCQDEDMWVLYSLNTEQE